MGASWGRFGTVLSGSWVPTWVPKWSQIRSKNRSKNQSFFGCLLESIFSWILVDFESQNEAKLEPKLNQTSSSQKTRKNAFGTSPLVPNWVQGIQVGSKTQPKIDPNMESKMQYLLASIFDTFQWILGGKMESRMTPKVMQKGIEKMITAAGGFGMVRL